MIPSEINNVNSPQKFKSDNRELAPENCFSYLCQPYIENFGFVDLVETFDLSIV